MKKTLIATAIAGAMGFSVAAQAAPTVYGNIQLVVDATEEMYAADNGSTVGFKGEEAMDNGLTAIYKAEFHFAAGTRDKNGVQANGISGSDQNYLGVKGDFGKVRVGAFDTIDDDFINDMVYGAEYADNRTSSFYAGEDQQVQYMGEFGALTVGASVQLNEGNDQLEKTDGTGKAAAGEQAMQFGVKFAVAEGMTVSAAADSEDGVGVGFKAAMGGMTFGAKYENSDNYDSVIGASVDMDYGMGNAYAVADVADNGTDDATNFTVGATYNITNSLYAYAELGAGDTVESTGTASKDGAEATAIGAVLSF